MSVHIVNTSAQIYKYLGAPHQWKLIGTNGDLIATDGGGNTYMVKKPAGNQREILKYTGNGDRWQSVGFYYTSSNITLWQGKVLHVANGNVYESYGAIIGTGADRVIGGGDRLLMVRPNGELLLYTGNSQWTVIGGSVALVAIDRDKLYVTNSGTGNIWQYGGTPHNWFMIDNRRVSIMAAGGGKLCVLVSGDARIWQYNGTPNSFTEIGGGAKNIAMEGATCYCHSMDDSLWRNDGAPHRWTQVGVGISKLVAAERPGMRYLVQPLPPHAAASPSIDPGAQRTFVLSMAHSGLAITATGNNTVVQQRPWVESPEQQWRFRPVGDGTFYIDNVGNGQSLDDDGNNPNNGGRIQTWSFHGGLNQRWFLEEVDAGHFNIRSASSRRVVDTPYASMDHNYPLHHWDSHGGMNQKVILSQVAPRERLLNAEVTLYEHPNYGGRAMRLGLGPWSLIDMGYNDVVSSLKVPSGLRVSLCEHEFAGTKINYSSDTPNVGGFDNKASSALVEKVATFYEHPNFGGQSSQLGVGTYDISVMGLPNDCISALRVPQGLMVTLCQHRNWQGDFRNFLEDCPSLGSFDNQTSSIIIRQIGVVVPRTAFRFGDKIQLKTAHQKYMGAESDGRLLASHTQPGEWESFTVVRAGMSTDNSILSFGDIVALRAQNGKYLVAESDGRANANRDAIGPWEQWQIIRAGGTQHTTFVSRLDHVALKSVAHNRYLVAESDGRANANRGAIGPWETFMVGGTPSALAGGMEAALPSEADPSTCVQEACGADACWQDFCVADACGAAACGVAATLVGACGVAAAGIAVCGADVVGVGACGAAACGAAAAGVGACGADACGAAACGAAVCGAAACGAAACGADVCGAAACSADATSVNVALVNVHVANVEIVTARVVDGAGQRLCRRAHLRARSRPIRGGPRARAVVGASGRAHHARRVRRAGARRRTGGVCPTAPAACRLPRRLGSPQDSQRMTRRRMIL